MKRRNKRSLPVGRACHDAVDKVGSVASRPFVRAGLALLAESLAAFAFLYVRRRVREKRTA